jgi:hypothetical protein
MELMHVSCIFSKANNGINVRIWLCPKCKYLEKLALPHDQPKVVVEEIVWALLDGLWLPATVSYFLLLFMLDNLTQRIYFHRLLQKQSTEIYLLPCLCIEM